MQLPRRFLLNRVKKVSRKYEEIRPLIDHQREIRSHTRNTVRAAARVKAARTEMQKAVEIVSLKAMTTKELRALVKQREIQGRSKLITKSQLLKALGV